MPREQAVVDSNHRLVEAGNSATLSLRASQKSEGTEQQGYGSQGLRRKLPHLSLDILHAKMVHEHQHPIVQRGQHLGRLALLHLTDITLK
jgi:hypothetical protein